MEDGSEESKLWGERQVRRISVMHVRDHADLDENGSSRDGYCENILATFRSKIQNDVIA